MQLDADSVETRELLLLLYKNAFPEMSVPELQGKEWKDLGFQVAFCPSRHV